jgi:hypothetical protein
LTLHGSPPAQPPNRPTSQPSIAIAIVVVVVVEQPSASLPCEITTTRNKYLHAFSAKARDLSRGILNREILLAALEPRSHKAWEGRNEGIPCESGGRDGEPKTKPLHRTITRSKIIFVFCLFMSAYFLLPSDRISFYLHFIPPPPTHPTPRALTSPTCFLLFFFAPFSILRINDTRDKIRSKLILGSVVAKNLGFAKLRDSSQHFTLHVVGYDVANENPEFGTWMMCVLYATRDFLKKIITAHGKNNNNSFLLAFTI